MMACQNGRVPCARALLEAKADPNSRVTFSIPSVFAWFLAVVPLRSLLSFFPSFIHSFIPIDRSS